MNTFKHIGLIVMENIFNIFNFVTNKKRIKKLEFDLTKILKYMKLSDLCTFIL